MWQQNEIKTIRVIACMIFYLLLVDFITLLHKDALNNPHQTENRWGKQGSEDAVQRNT